MVRDASYNAANQELQGGADWEVSGKFNVDRLNGGSSQVDDVRNPLFATFTPAAGSANHCLVSIQLSDGIGNMNVPNNIDVFLSDSASGLGLTATTASGAVQAGASGADLGDYTAKKAKRVQTTAAGLYILDILDTSKTGFFPCVQLPCGRIIVGAQLVTGNYG